MSNSGKTLAYHIAVGDFGVVLAKGDFSSTPARIDLIKMLNPAEGGLGDRVREFIGAPKGGYVKASCSFSPVSRFLRKAAIESPAKAKSPNFLADLMQVSCKINPEVNEVAALLPTGQHYNPDESVPKDLIFVGAATKDIVDFQSDLMSWGVYPVSIAISSLACVAAVVKVATAEGRKNPTLMLEIGEEQSFIYIINTGSVDFTRQVPFGFKHMLPQIKSELGLADEAVARKILWANTFDFTEMAPVLLRKLVKEIQASVGFYEVQTGYATGQIFLPDLPTRFGWINAHLSHVLSLDSMQIDFDSWPAKIDVALADAAADAGLDNLCWSLLAQVGSYE